MLPRLIALWILGLLTLVPYGTYYLLFQAPREQYALLIVGILFWIFGFWGVVGPLLAAIKVRRVFRAIEQIRSRDQLLELLQRPETRETAIDLIATENNVPRFIAARVYGLLVHRFSQTLPTPRPPEAPPSKDARQQHER